MNEEVLQRVGPGRYYDGTSGLKILQDVGVVVASDFIHIDDSDLAHRSMNLNLVDRKKVCKIREGLPGDIHV
jgi:hypothetical protein